MLYPQQEAESKYACYFTGGIYPEQSHKSYHLQFHKNYHFSIFLKLHVSLLKTYAIIGITRFFMH